MLDKYTPIGDEAITVNTATGFTAAKILPATGAFAGRYADAVLLTVETDQIRYRFSGTPTSTVGHLVEVGDMIFIEGADAVSMFLMIKVTNNASVYATYFRLR